MATPEKVVEDMLVGTVGRIVFQSEETGFAIFWLIRKDDEPIVAKGVLDEIRTGRTVECHGSFKDDERYGRQFNAAMIAERMPDDEEGIRKYLSSGVLPGVGEAMAERIIEHFGVCNVFDALDRDPGSLAKIKGVGEKTVQRIKKLWPEIRLAFKTQAYLRTLGIGASHAQKVHRYFKAMGLDAQKSISTNPYVLSDIGGIGFKTADEVAMRLGVKPNSEYRKRSGIEYVIRTECLNGGHILVPVSQAMAAAKVLLSVDDGFEEAMDHLVHPDRTERKENKGKKNPLIRPKMRYAEMPDGVLAISPVFLFHDELGVAQRMAALSGPNGIANMTVEDVIEEGRLLGLNLARSQAAALSTILTARVAVLTGGPGTGKTTVTHVLLEIAKRKGIGPVLCAPTGRASKRMSEATGHPASTIHRLLGMDHQTGRFKHHEENPLEGDLFLMDEASMVDVHMMHCLLRALPSHAMLILIGDPDQLPSVAPGNVLRDIIASGVVAVGRLTEIFRQGKGSGISIAAHSVINGQFPQKAADFRLAQEDETPGCGKILAMVQKLFGEGTGYRDIQVLSPMVKGPTGVIELNKALQALINPDQGLPGVKVFDTVFRVGDRVLQTRNNYELEIFNGDIGYVVGVDADAGVVLVDFSGSDEGVVKLEKGNLEDLMLAYAMTIHKSQGGQFKAVVMPVSTQHYIMLNRNLVYTGITRAEKDVIIVGTPKAMSMAVSKDGSAKRLTLLSEHLRELVSA